VLRAGEGEPQAFADDLMVVHDQAGDLALPVPFLHGLLGHGARIVRGNAAVAALAR
jgi:hypothetical protein